MKAHLYIDDRTFKYNGTDSMDGIATKIADFTDLVCFVIPKKQDNIIARNNKFYNTCLIDSMTVYDYLCDTSNTQDEFRDVQEQLRAAIFSPKFEEQDIDDDNFTELLEIDSNALIVFNKITDENINKKNQILAAKADWYLFHRNYLANNASTYSADAFLAEAKLYFDLLVFCDDGEMLSGLRKVYKSHPKKIVHGLTLLNDDIRKDFASSSKVDFIDFLKSDFKAKHCKKHNNRQANDNKDESINDAKYEPYKKGGKDYGAHLTIDSDDKGKTSVCKKNCKCRIYFASLTSKNDEKVCLGLITDHIKS